MKNNDTALEKVLNSISHYLQSRENIITNIHKTDNFNDYPLFYHYITEYLPRNGYNQDDLLANGISLDKNEALVKAVMETIERWYLSNYDEKKLPFDSYTNFRKSKKAINPESFLAVSKKQLSSKNYANFLFDDKTSFYWTKTKSLNTGENIFIPAQLIHFMYHKKHTEPIIRLPDSIGASAGSSIEQALYKGICELIERDAYAILYYNRLSGRKIDLTNLKDKEILSLINYIKKHYFKVIIFDITMDINVPVFMCLLIDETNSGPKVNIGVKCSLFPKEAIYGAIMEALQGLNSTRNMVSIKQSLTRKNFNKIGNAIRPILDRVLFWAKPASIKDIKFLLDSPSQALNLSLYDTPKDSSDVELLKLVSKRLAEVGIGDIYWKQVTPTALDKFSLFGVKVVIPKLQPVSLDNRYLYFAGERLYSVPVKLNRRESPIHEEKLNKVPHPLP